MGHLFQNYYKMPDGTIKQVNPLTGTAVWTVPLRGSKPVTNVIPSTAQEIQTSTPEDYCSFCENNKLQTPPEKARLVEIDGNYSLLEGVPADSLDDTVAEFRRIANLFGIVSFDYWAKNYDYQLTEECERRKERYLSSAEGVQHVVDVINFKLRAIGHAEAQIRAMSLEEKLHMANAFFAAGDELIVARRHYKPSAKYDVDLYSSGEMTPEEHYQYFAFTIEAMKDIVASNRYVRYISVFQNWLASAGASFDHLHKQLVGIDEWGVAIERELEGYRNDNNLYNDKVANFASYHNLVFAENEHAIAFADVGRRYPTIAIYSKSEHAMPQHHTKDEVRGVSDLVHACHAAMGSQIPCNEEWFYSPVDCRDNIPWHITIGWRTVNPAGFEGGTRIYVNPVSPEDLRDKMVPRLIDLRDQAEIATFAIASECPAKPNSLRYVAGHKA